MSLQLLANLARKPIPILVAHLVPRLTSARILSKHISRSMDYATIVLVKRILRASLFLTGVTSAHSRTREFPVLPCLLISILRIFSRPARFDERLSGHVDLMNSITRPEPVLDPEHDLPEPGFDNVTLPGTVFIMNMTCLNLVLTMLRFPELFSMRQNF